MRRRRFLQIAAAGTIAGAAAPQVGFAEIDRGLDQLAHPDMLRQIGSHRLIRTLGDAYRRENPDENDAHRLGRLVLDAAGRSDAPSVFRPAPGEYPGDLRSRLDQLVRHDFAAGRTVQVRGWIISRTEARQCALYSLLYV